MSAQPSEDPRRRRPSEGQRAPARPAAPPSPYRRPEARPRPNVVQLPDGYKATVEPPVSSSGFLGGSFAMDSQKFLRWLAVYFHDDAASLRVVLYLMGIQEPGGLVIATQREMAAKLTVDQAQISRSLRKLTALGLVHSPRRGRYQLQPRATLRGGTLPVEAQRTGTRTHGVRVKVDQQELLFELSGDDDVPEEFKYLMLPPPAEKKRRGKRSPEA